MPVTRSGSVCILPKQLGLGGPGSFQNRMKRGLEERSIPYHHDPLDPTTAAILVIAGTNRALQLWQARQRGVRIVQRLDGMNWVHRKRRTGWRHFLRAERNNLLLDVIRRSLAHVVVYQSQFVRDWWQAKRGTDRVETTVIYNGADLELFHPEGPHERPADHWRVQVVEGHLKGGNEKGLEIAVRLNQYLNQGRPGAVELVVAADVDPEVRTRLEGLPGTSVRWEGVVEHKVIPYLDRSAHALFSAEVNPPCPNSVIEAMACGLPVAGYATGSLPELVAEGAGVVVPYGSDHWNMEEPDYAGMAAGLMEIFSHQDTFRAAARHRAETHFSAEEMVEKYIEVLLG